MAKNTMTDRELDALNREILRENQADKRRDRYNGMVDQVRAQFSSESTPVLSARAIRDALLDIDAFGKYFLPAEMPKCEKNSLYTVLDRIVKARVA